MAGHLTPKDKPKACPPGMKRDPKTGKCVKKKQ